MVWVVAGWMEDGDADFAVGIDYLLEEGREVSGME